MRHAWINVASVAIAVGLVVALEVAGVPGGRAVEFLLIAVAAGIFAARTVGRRRDLMVSVCSLALGLAVTFALVPILFPGARTGKQPALSGDKLISKRPVVGWGPRHPGVFHLVKTDADGHVIFDVHATIGENLFRKTVSSKGPHPVAFFGDSFVFGDGLDDGETLPQAFADLNHGAIPVLNLGFSGWAPSQNLASLEQGLVRKELGQPRRMILFTALFHVERTACKGAFALGSGPRYVLERGVLIDEGTCVGSRPRILTTILRFLRGLTLGAGASERPTARDVETYIAIIEAFVARARQDYGVGTTVLMEPGDDDLLAETGFDQAKVTAALQHAGVDVLVKAKPPRGRERLYRIEGDAHPTGLANRATAAQLEEHLRLVAPGIFDMPSPPSDPAPPLVLREDRTDDR